MLKEMYLFLVDPAVWTHRHCLFVSVFIGELGGDRNNLFVKRSGLLGSPRPVNRPIKTSQSTTQFHASQSKPVIQFSNPTLTNQKYR